MFRLVNEKRVTPLDYGTIFSTPHGVEVRPVVDFTKIGITVLLGFVGVWRALRR